MSQDDLLDWFVQERKRLGRQSLWAAGVAVAAFLVVALLARQQTRWAMAPLPIALAAVIWQGYITSKLWALRRRARSEGVNPRATPRQLVFLGAFGVLALVLGLDGLHIHDAQMAIYGLLGFVLMAFAIGQTLWARRRE